MTRLEFKLDPEKGRDAVGLIVLQADETLEPELARSAPDLGEVIYTSRIPSAPEVTPETLAAMKDEISRAAALLPPLRYSAVGYACTSASAVIGSDAVAAIVQCACDTTAVTNPLAATVARARDLGVTRLAIVSPYVEAVNEPLKQAFVREGLEITAFGSFGVGIEKEVARISTGSVIAAATEVGSDDSAEAVFLSCTNLRTLDAISEIGSRLGKPVISSNSALIWHLRQLNAMSESADKASK